MTTKLHDRILAAFCTTDSQRTHAQIYEQVDCGSSELTDALDELVTLGKLRRFFSVRGRYSHHGLEDFETRESIPATMSDEWLDDPLEFEVGEADIVVLYRRGPAAPELEPPPERRPWCTVWTHTGGVMVDTYERYMGDDDPQRRAFFGSQKETTAEVTIARETHGQTEVWGIQLRHPLPPGTDVEAAKRIADALLDELERVAR